jgi:NitT/TauT family transport system permease protein
MGVFFTLTIATVAEIKRIPENLLITAENLGEANLLVGS